jgi:ubiquitin carboxyl-terminal hydrolase L5
MLWLTRLILGNIDSDDWTTLARPHIEARMLQYEESQLSFNLLSLCQDPLASYARDVLEAAVCLRYMREQLSERAGFLDLVSQEEHPLNLDDATNLSEFGLQRTEVEVMEIPKAFRAKIANPALDLGDAYGLYQSLVVDVKAAMGEYRAELLAMAEAEQRVRGRKKEWQPAIHKWMTKLAEKSALADIIKTS